MEYSDAAHKRAVEIEAALAELFSAGSIPILTADTILRAQKALLPIYEPLVPEKEWSHVGYETESDIGATYLEAAADRLEAKHRAQRIHSTSAGDLRDWAKLERAIGS